MPAIKFGEKVKVDPIHSSALEHDSMMKLNSRKNLKFINISFLNILFKKLTKY